MKESVIYCLTQTIYDFLDEKFLFLNDEQQDHSLSNITDHRQHSVDLSPEGMKIFLQY